MAQNETDWPGFGITVGQIALDAWFYNLQLSAAQPLCKPQFCCYDEANMPVPLSYHEHTLYDTHGVLSSVPKNTQSAH